MRTVTVRNPAGKTGPWKQHDDTVVWNGNGEAELPADHPLVAHFRQKGYFIDGKRREAPPTPEPVDPRDLPPGGTKLNTLRDAAVDPRPGDSFGLGHRIPQPALEP